MGSILWFVPPYTSVSTGHTTMHSLNEDANMINRIPERTILIVPVAFISLGTIDYVSKVNDCNTVGLIVAETQSPQIYGVGWHEDENKTHWLRATMGSLPRS